MALVFSFPDCRVESACPMTAGNAVGIIRPIPIEQTVIKIMQGRISVPHDRREFSKLSPELGVVFVSCRWRSEFTAWLTLLFGVLYGDNLEAEDFFKYSLRGGPVWLDAGNVKGDELVFGETHIPVVRSHDVRTSAL